MLGKVQFHAARTPDESNVIYEQLLDREVEFIFSNIVFIYH